MPREDRSAVKINNQVVMKEGHGNGKTSGSDATDGNKTPH